MAAEFDRVRSPSALSRGDKTNLLCYLTLPYVPEVPQNLGGYDEVGDILCDQFFDGISLDERRRLVGRIYRNSHVEPALKS